jgi:hypothetical protein
MTSAGEVRAGIERLNVISSDLLLVIAIATRNPGHLAPAGVGVVNPFSH